MVSAFFIVAAAYALILLKVSFLPHFYSFGGSYLIMFFAGLLLLVKDLRMAFTLALASGFLLDVFSNAFFGFHALILLAVIIVARIALMSYVRVFL